MKIDWKKYQPIAIILAIFFVATLIYFWPAYQGQDIYSSEHIGAAGTAADAIRYHEETGDYTYWTDNMFSGMPNYQIGGGGGSFVDRLFSILHPLIYNVKTIFFFYLLAFFILLRTFGVGRWQSVAGAFAIAMSSYFFVVIAAAHHGKCFSIMYMTLVWVGFMLMYRKKYALGAMLVIFFMYIGFYMHPQMSYYMCMLIGVCFFAELALAIQSKDYKTFIIATCVFGASFLVGLGMGASKFFINQEYLAETMRGGHSDLENEDHEGQETGGLDFDYATAWSEGINESLTFLVPNYMGGASGFNLGKDSQLEKEMRAMGVPASSAKQFCQSAPTYWGDKAFTSGPVYMGAVVIFLFLLGLIIVSGPYKWALLVATLFSVLLSWGRHFPALTQLFFDYFPMYNRFRAVESILIVAEITVPVLGFLALKTINDKTWEWKKLQKAILVAGGLTALVCMIIAFASSGIDTTSAYDSWKAQVGDQIYDAILSQRQALIKADAWRSFWFVLLGVAGVYWYANRLYNGKSNDKTQLVFGLAFAALIVADMWPVDKRFCNDNDFRPTKEHDKLRKMYPYEQSLLQDKSYFRVLNLASNTFNESRTSLYLNSIGGYSAAKLRRYQDLIDQHISKLNINVLNMLNTKYIIANKDGQVGVQLNQGAMGMCWLVDSLVYVNNANDESESLRTLDLHRYAVVDTTYAVNSTILNSPQGQWQAPSSPEDRFEMVDHNPKKVTYYANVQGPRLAVLSEIFYPHGWKMMLDGQPYFIGKKSSPILRVNYMLRALVVPAGEHTIELIFDPDSARKGNALALSCFAIFLCVAAYACYEEYKKRKVVVKND